MVTLLNQPAFRLLKKYKIPTADYKEVSSASKLKFPVVLKASSPKIIHKTEKGAIAVCCTKKQAEDFLKKFRKKAKIIAQEKLDGVELIIGIKKDPTFRHTIMFGLGGIYTEIFKDVSFRACPVNKKQALEMIKEVKVYQLLKGARGKKPADLNLLANIISNISQMAVKEDIKELDINPFIISGKQGKAADARIIL